MTALAALVIAEHDNASLKGSTLNTVTAAVQTQLQAGGNVHVLVAGHNAKAAADAAAQIAGVTKVLLADAPHFADGLAENVAEQALAIAKDYTHILAPATAYGKNILPRLLKNFDFADLPVIINVHKLETDIPAEELRDGSRCRQTRHSCRRLAHRCRRR